MNAKRVEHRMWEAALMFNGAIWKRDFELPVVFDCFNGEAVLPEQQEAYQVFCNSKEAINHSISDVKQYCITQNKSKIEEDSIENVFKYVVPEKVYVTRDCRVAIMCRYKFDLEHGIAVVFKNGQFEQIGAQDIVL